jgi:hypothetical protein
VIVNVIGHDDEPESKMNRHLDEYLCKKYPKIFLDRHKPMNETAMCWGFECGNGWFFLIDQLCASIQNHIDNPQYIEPKTLIVKFKKLWNKTVWNWVLYPIGRRFILGEKATDSQWKKWNKFQDRWNIQWDCIPGPQIPQVVAAQVKEKFGGLRFYVSGGDVHTSAMINFAESLSYKICEDCGRTDELVAIGGKGWIKTTCPRHAKDKEYHNKIANQEYVELWKKVRKDSKKT